MNKLYFLNSLECRFFERELVHETKDDYEIRVLGGNTPIFMSKQPGEPLYYGTDKVKILNTMIEHLDKKMEKDIAKQKSIIDNLYKLREEQIKTDEEYHITIDLDLDEEPPHEDEIYAWAKYITRNSEESDKLEED